MDPAYWMEEFDHQGRGKNIGKDKMVKVGKKDHSRSKGRLCTIRKTLEAAVRFNPTPPTLSDIKST